MDIIRYTSLKSGPWACGTTRQIAAGPDNSSDWGWRLSLAEVAKAGSFTPLPGSDRIITVIDGDLIALSVDGAEQPLEKFRPFRFSGDAVTSATLPTGALRVLNFTTRRDSFKGYAAIIELSKKRPHPVFADQLAVLLQGSATVADAEPLSTDCVGAPSAPPIPEPLGKFDTVIGNVATPEISGRGFLAVLSIDVVS